MFLPATISPRIFRWLLCGLFAALAARASAINWNYLDGPFGGRVVALAHDAAGNTWAASLDSRIFYRAAGTQTWVYRGESPTQLTFWSPDDGQPKTQFAIDSAGDIYLTSGTSGLYAFAVGATTWTRVSGTNGLPNEPVSALATDAAGTVYAAISASVYKLINGSTLWTLAGSGHPPPNFTTVSNLAIDDAGNAWATIDRVGVYKLAPGSDAWVKIDAGLYVPVVGELIAVGSDLFAGNYLGVFKLANASGGAATWVPWVGGEMKFGDPVYTLARGANRTLYAHGLGFVYTVPTVSNAWKKLGNGLEQYYRSYSLVYSSLDGSLTLGNDYGVFVLPAGGSTWEAQVEGMTSSAVGGLLVAQNGDIYATVSGLGIQRQAAGTTTWSAVDPAHVTPFVGAVTIDSHGTIFAVDAGRVVKLVNDSWVTAGDGQNGCAASLHADASDTLWAACIPSNQLGVQTELKVQKLASGASTWVSAGAVGGVYDGGVTNVTVDGAGTAYVGSFGLGYVGSEGFGIYSLAPNATTWTLNNVGLGNLDVLALQRDAGGAVYAATGDGVYKLVAGSWQRVGTGLDTYVTALLIDTNGDLYAGTGTGAWRLAAGTSTWTQIRLGLNGTVNTLAPGGGRIYAGTGVNGGSDGMGGSPSGVYMLVGLNVGAETGWWWNASESGRGFFIEQEGTTIVMAGYIYDDSGNPIWFLASGTIVDNVFTAEMQTYRNGQTLTGPYVGPATGPSLGTITVHFSSAEQATVTWPGGTFSIARFAFGAGGPGTPENGWWWSSSESGRGFSIEVKGNTLVMAGYMYSVAGTPIWYLSSGTMTSSSAYTGSLQQYAMGQSIGGPYHSPQLANANVGTVSLVFTDAKNGTITLPDGRQVAITRFAF